MILRQILGCLSGNPIDSRTKLLAHCDGENGGNAFVDDSLYRRALTAVGPVSTYTAEKKFGSACASIAPGGEITAAQSVDFAFGTGDFTVDMWIKVTAWTTNALLFTTGGASGMQFGRNTATNDWGVAEAGVT